MAISAPTFVFPNQIEFAGAQKRVVARYTLDSSYPTGGYSITPNSVGLSVINAARATVDSPSTSEYVAAFDRTNNKVKLFGGAASGVALAEVTAATNVATVVVEVDLIGV